MCFQSPFENLNIIWCLDGLREFVPQLWGAHWECSVTESLIRVGDRKQRLKRRSKCASEEKLVHWERKKRDQWGPWMWGEFWKMRCSSGSQWRSHRTGVIEENLRVRETNIAIFFAPSVGGTVKIKEDHRTEHWRNRDERWPEHVHTFLLPL